MKTIHNGDHSEAIKKLQRAINLRLSKRDAPNHIIKVDGVFGPSTRQALRYAAFLLGAPQVMLDSITTGGIGPGEQDFIYNPGNRNANERKWATQRLAAHRKARAKVKKAAQSSNSKRQAIVREALKAAANYRKNPGAYHYLAGGIANLIYLTPSPSNYRSDCSNFGANVYNGAGLPSPASVPHEWASTYTMVKAPGVRFVTKANRKPGMLGMYGSKTAPHHVEIYVGTEDVDFVGHGSQPIDSLTPGEPDYYIDFDFLN